jgi:hypothetical protein
MASCFEKVLLICAFASLASSGRVVESQSAPPWCDAVMADVVTMSELLPPTDWVGEYRCYNGADVMVECVNAAGRAECSLAASGNDLLSEAWRRGQDITGDLVSGIGGLFSGSLPQKPDPHERMRSGPSDEEREKALSKYDDADMTAMVQQAWGSLNNFERDVILAYLTADGKAVEEAKTIEKAYKSGSALTETIARTHDSTAHAQTIGAHSHGNAHRSDLGNILRAILEGMQRKNAARANEWGRTTWGADRSDVFNRGSNNWAYKLLKFFGWTR